MACPMPDWLPDSVWAAANALKVRRVCPRLDTKNRQATTQGTHGIFHAGLLPDSVLAAVNALKVGVLVPARSSKALVMTWHGQAQCCQYV